MMALGTFAITVMGIQGGGQTAPGVLDGMPFFDMWIRWDAGWYRQIAEDGYTYSATEQSSAAFFPLYPLLIRFVMWATGLPVFIAGIVTTWLTGFACCLTFYAWAANRSDEATAGRTLWLLLAWPFSFFICGAMYSDATFLLVITLAFLMLERERPWGAVLFGALAAATRPLAPAIVLGLLVRSLELRRRAGKPLRVIDFLPLAAGLGLVAYMVFLHREFGDAVGFATTQKGWNQLSGLSSMLKVEGLSKLSGAALFLPAVHAVLAGFCLFLGWRLRHTLGWGYSVYVLIVVGIPLLSSRDFIGLGRYALAGFPVFLELERWLARSPRVRTRWLVASVALLSFMVIRFARAFYTA
jgi:Gpi18-like mannosyltransferase